MYVYVIIYSYIYTWTWKGSDGRNDFVGIQLTILAMVGRWGGRGNGGNLGGDKKRVADGKETVEVREGAENSRDWMGKVKKNKQISMASGLAIGHRMSGGGAAL